MDDRNVSKTSAQSEERKSKEYEELVSSLPRVNNYGSNLLLKYQDYWITHGALRGTICFQKHFRARDTDIILVTFPKCGTTWLKALLFSIVNRAYHAPNSATHPLLSCNPHNLVPFFELLIYCRNDNPNLDNLPSPRIFATHLPFSLLPQCIPDSNCRIVYLCRNPLDQLISYWCFLTNLFPEHKETSSIEEQVDMFCKGLVSYGPYWEHVLGYWYKSLEKKDRVLFLKYEDLKEDITSHCIKVADFLGFPFTEEEKKRGVVEEIPRLCCFEKLKDLEVNISGESDIFRTRVRNNTYFRKGEVGDWVNYLTPAMAERIEKLLEEKFEGSGITFKMISQLKRDCQD